MNDKKYKTMPVRLRWSLACVAVLLVVVSVPLIIVSTVAALPSSMTNFAQGTTPNPVSPTSPTGSPPITVPKPPAQPDCPNGDCIINDYITPAVNALIAAVGVICVISLVIAGIQYSSAGGDPGKVSAAKGRIGKTIGAFLAFIFLYVFLNYIIPGGV
jgi:hypothetical protein